MGTDFDRDGLPSFITRRSSEEFPSKAGLNHLTYLEKTPSLFEHEEDDETRDWQLVCASCGHLITTVAEKVDIRGRHHHDFPYYGHVVRLGSYRNAPGCVGVERVSNGYSWFRGYEWQIQLCRNCYTQLGWKYMSRDDSFYGLVFKLLREERPEEDNATAPTGEQDNSQGTL
ncbi:MAG: cereblon family protein [Thermodesulfobacteriota bacterium]